MQIHDDKINIILLDLVINLQAELIVLRNQFETERGLANKKNPEQIEQDFNRRFQEARKAVLANIQANYLLDGSTDDLLNRTLGKYKRKKKETGT